MSKVYVVIPHIRFKYNTSLSNQSTVKNDAKIVLWK